jgi:Tfp pilus assembly protein PilW
MRAQLNHRRVHARRKTAFLAFTLSEMMTAMAIFSMVIIGVVYSHLFGMRMFSLTATKLSASQGARSALGRVRDEIRSSKVLCVGQSKNGWFTNTPSGQRREGNAVQIFPTVNTNSYVVFYVDTADQKLKRKSNLSGQTDVIASYITNVMAFRAEDFKGNILTNDQNNRIIKMTLEFYQWEFPSAQIAVGSYYDYYRLQTRISRRAIE